MRNVTALFDSCDFSVTQPLAACFRRQGQVFRCLLWFIAMRGVEYNWSRYPVEIPSGPPCEVMGQEERAGGAGAGRIICSAVLTEPAGVCQETTAVTFPLQFPSPKLGDACTNRSSWVISTQLARR